MHVKMAEAAAWGGSVGIRANSPRQIRDIKAAVDLPVIGLYKQWHEGSNVFITPTLDAVRAVYEAGAEIIMIESEGITENVTSWRTDVVAKFIDALGLEKVMFEAAEPDVFQWYIKNYGPEVNVFVDHSQIVQLETLRRGIWGTKSLWGRVLTYKG